MFHVAMRTLPRLTQHADAPHIPLIGRDARQYGGMSDGELNARPDTLDPGRDQRTYDKKGVSAGKVLNWLVLILVLAAAVVLAYGIAREFLPRRWAQEVVGVVDASRPRGLMYGFGVGLVFTLIPVLVLAQTRRRFLSWTGRAIVLVVAIILALPNWLTMAVAIGRSKSSVDGRILLDQSGPGFRDGSAAGAVIGALLGLIIVGFSMRLGQRRRQVAELRRKVSELEHQVAPKSDTTQPLDS
jgi:hypothetical protein